MKTKIKLTSLIIISIFLISSCTEDPKLEKENIQTEEITRDSLEAMFIQTLNEIDHNLEVIKEKEGVIVLGPNSNVESRIDTKEKILRNIQMINSLMEENKMKIEKLQSQLNKSNTDNKKLSQLTDAINAKFLKQEESINNLKEELNSKNYEIFELNTKLNYAELQSEKLDLMVSALEKELATGYLLIGTYKELKEKEVVEKEGGVLWFGRTKSIDENFNSNHFAVINTKDSTTIPVFSKKVKLLTKHPANSYEFEEINNQVSYLKITNPKQFWKASKYLIIETK